MVFKIIFIAVLFAKLLTDAQTSKKIKLIDEYSVQIDILKI